MPLLAALLFAALLFAALLQLLLYMCCVYIYVLPDAVYIYRCVNVRALLLLYIWCCVARAVVLPATCQCCRTGCGAPSHLSVLPLWVGADSWSMPEWPFGASARVLVKTVVEK